MKSDRNLWPMGIVTAFFLLFCGIAAVLVIAATHRDALVSDNYYENELKFQNQIDAASRAQKAGAKIRYDFAAGKIILTLPVEQAGQNVGGKIMFYRANAPELDRERLLKIKPDGTQTLDISGLVAGPWRIRVYWNAGGQDYFLEMKIII
jgi:nitrogen fixation protein FixH